MLNKFKNLFVKDKTISAKLIAIMLIILSSLLLSKTQDDQNIRLKRIKDEKQLVVKIPELEKQIKIYEDSGKAKLLELKIKIHKKPLLKGIFLKDKFYCALIADVFYREGDDCGDFDILKIDSNEVTIQYKDTQETEVLRISE